MALISVEASFLVFVQLLCDLHRKLSLCHTFSPLRQYHDKQSLSKIHKKHYDKIPENFISLLFAEISMEKSYNLDIYKSRSGVYNESPE